METHISRREFLKLTAASGATFLLAACGAGAGDKQSLTLFDRLKGEPLTQPPQITEAWSTADAVLTLDLSRLPELETLGGAVRIEGEALADPVLVVQGEDGEFYAFKNVCMHGGRMLDPLQGTLTIQCCSMSKSTYDYDGNVLSGPAKGPLTRYALARDGAQLKIQLE